MIGQTTSKPAPDRVPETRGGTAAIPAAEGTEGEAVASGKTAREFGGRDGPDPTRYGDWEKNGRCIDF